MVLYDESQQQLRGGEGKRKKKKKKEEKGDILAEKSRRAWVDVEVRN